MALSETDMELFFQSFCLPVALIVNFALFQYLMTMYYKRRREIRGALLLTCAFGGFVTLIPFAYPNPQMVGHLNDISETCSVLTFLIQITIIGRDISRKVKITLLRYLTYASELLILFGLFVVAQNVFEVCFPSVGVGKMDGLDNVIEEVGLLFIFCFRFIMLVMSKGYCFVLENKKLEMFMYFLFITHEYPFAILEEKTSVPWEGAQVLWHRLTLALCVGLTISEKLRINSSKLGTKMTTNASMGPSIPKAAVNTITVATAPSTHSVRQAMSNLSSRLSFRGGGASSSSSVRPAGVLAVSVVPPKPKR